MAIKKKVFFCKEWLRVKQMVRTVSEQRGRELFVEEPMGAKTNNNIRRGLINNKPVTINQATADDAERESQQVLENWTEG